MMAKDVKSNQDVAVTKKRKKKKMSTRDRVIMAISIVLICASVLTIAGIGLWNWQVFGGDQIDSENKTPVELREKNVNFLICGIDVEPGRNHKLTDVIMYVNFDIQSKKVNILQIPRDTYIGEDYPTGKINAVYNQTKNGGINGLISVINDRFKLTIDHYATVTMDGFVRVVDGIGGVEMDVPRTITLEGVTIKKGYQTLNGKQAEKFVRKRKGDGYKEGDIERIKMQRLFLAAMMKKIKSTSITTLGSLITKVSKDITSDMKVGEMIDFAGAVHDIDMTNMNVSMLPGQGTSYNGYSVYTLHKQETADLLNNNFRPYSEKVSAESLNIIELKKTTSYYDDNTDSFDGLVNGVKPGSGSSGTSSSTSGGTSSKK